MSVILPTQLAEDLRKVLCPAAIPVKPTRKLRVCVDPGHGGTDPGAVVPGAKEKDLVLPYAQALYTALLLRGHEAVLTRSTDVFVKLGDRSVISNNFRADCFVSIHANYSSNPNVHGTWLIHDDHSSKGKQLALAIYERMAKIPGIPDDDPEPEVYADNSGWTGGRDLAVLGPATKCPAVLVEVGFISNAEDLAQLKQDQTKSLVATAIIEGIESWAG